MIHKSKNKEDNLHAYALPEISVIPPIQTQSCHIDLYYNGNVLVDTFYLFKDRPPTSQFKNWTIQDKKNGFRNLESGKIQAGGQDVNVNVFYNMDHYTISLQESYDENNGVFKPQGKEQ